MEEKENDNWQPPKIVFFVKDTWKKVKMMPQTVQTIEKWERTEIQLFEKRLKNVFYHLLFLVRDGWSMIFVLLLTSAVEIPVAGVVCPCLAGIPSCALASRDTLRHRHLGVFGAGQTCVDATFLHHCASLYCCVFLEAKEGVHEVHCIFVKVRGGGGGDELCC